MQVLVFPSYHLRLVQLYRFRLLDSRFWYMCRVLLVVDSMLYLFIVVYASAAFILQGDSSSIF